MARYSTQGRDGIAALADNGLLDAEVLQARCLEAMESYIGDLTFLRINVIPGWDAGTQLDGEVLAER